MFSNLLLWQFKAILAIIVFVVNIASALITACCCRGGVRASLVSAGKMFSAGIFMSLIFFLQYPEVQHAEHELHEKFGFTWSGFGVSAMFAGMILAYLLDVAGKKWEEYGSREKKSDVEEHELENLPKPQTQDSQISDDVADESQKTKVPKKKSAVSFLLHCVLMSLHSLAEGLLLGYKKDDSDVFAYFAPLLVHNALEAIGIAAEGHHQDDKRLALIGSICHSLMTPLGTLIGWFLTDYESSQIVVMGQLGAMGVSMGMSVHHAFTAFYVPETNSTALLFTKLVFFVAGLAVPPGLSYATAHAKEWTELLMELFR